jgi:hypothetical protein
MADCKHDPDWDNIEAERSKGVVYIQVRCLKCHELGSVDYASVEIMNDQVSWD